MYKNFNITESEKEQILNRLKENGYGQPINEQNFPIPKPTTKQPVPDVPAPLNLNTGRSAEVYQKQNGETNVTSKKEEPKTINPTSNDVAGDLRGQVVNLYCNDETEFGSPEMEVISKIIKTNDGCDIYFHNTEKSVHFKWKCGDKSFVYYFNETNQIVKFKPPHYNKNFTNELTKRFCSVTPEVKIDFPSKRSKQTVNVNPINEQSTGETPITGTTQTSTENPQKTEPTQPQDPSTKTEPSKGSPLRGTYLEGDLKGKVVEFCSDKDETTVVGTFTIISIRKLGSEFRITFKSGKTNKTLFADYSCASTSRMGNWALEAMSVNLDGSGALYYNSDFLGVLKNKFCIERNNYGNDVPNADFTQVKNNTSTTNTLSEGKQILMDVFKKLIK